MLNGVNGISTSPSASSGTCNQCGEKKGVLPYIFPTQNGKKEFCSEPCLSNYRNAQKGIHTLNIQVLYKLTYFLSHLSLFTLSDSTTVIGSSKDGCRRIFSKVSTRGFQRC